jgi:hypothetical protein
VALDDRARRVFEEFIDSIVDVDGSISKSGLEVAAEEELGRAAVGLDADLAAARGRPRGRDGER